MPEVTTLPTTTNYIHNLLNRLLLMPLLLATRHSSFGRSTKNIAWSVTDAKKSICWVNKCINKQWTNSSISIPRDCIHSLCNKNTSRFEEDDNESNNKANPWHFRVLAIGKMFPHILTWQLSEKGRRSWIHIGSYWWLILVTVTQVGVFFTNSNVFLITLLNCNHMVHSKP